MATPASAPASPPPSPPITAPRPHGSRKPVTESARRRELYSYFQPAPDTPDLCPLFDRDPDAALPSGFVARASKDAALTAFAQLAAVRLDVSRALVSLIDGSRQYILAESTRSLSLRSASRHRASDQLWLGNVVLPRQKALCEAVLSLPGPPSEHAQANADDVVVIDDLSKEANCPLQSLSTPDFSPRFYAGAPIRTWRGAVIGSFAILDDSPHNGLHQDSLVLLQEMAATVMEHLDIYRLREHQRRGEQMVRGLKSFMTGEASLLPPSPTPSQGRLRSNTPDPDEPIYGRGATAKESGQGGATTAVQASADSPNSHPASGPRSRNNSTPDTSNHSGEEEGQGDASRAIATEQLKRSPTLQESILPPKSKEMFARAANIMRQASDLDGVIMFDAAISIYKGDTRHVHDPNVTHSSSRHSGYVSGSSDSSSAGTPSSNEQSEASVGMGSGPESDRGSDQRFHRTKRCEILAFSNIQTSSVAVDTGNKRDVRFEEADLSKLLAKYPNGKIFNITDAGTLSGEDGDSASDRPVSPAVKNDAGPTKRVKRARKSELSMVLELDPRARSIVLLPLWDYQREKWFAGCFCWTTGNRILHENDLQYFRVFGNSIMMELSRLDALAADRAKTTFIASISHELRSPLHGILGGVEFLQDTSVDAFQAGMISSIEMCGKTLLDTVDHILDFSKINKFREVSRKRNAGHVRSRRGSKRSSHDNDSLKSLTTAVDLSILTEEVVEACLAGQVYQAITRASEAYPSSLDLSRQSSQQGPSSGVDEYRKDVRISIDIRRRHSWKFLTEGGAMRRILSNLFGNALKYTVSGNVHISLDAEEPGPDDGDDAMTEVSLTVEDSGIGISEDFLYNKLYSPFSQEDPFSVGTGLGLSIVRSVSKSMGAKIHFRSTQQIGTIVKVDFKLPRPSVSSEMSFGGPEEFLAEVAIQLQDRRVGILETLPLPSLETSEGNQRDNGNKTTSSLMSCLGNWFEIQPFILDAHDSESADDADIIICTEPSFDFLSSIRTHRRKVNLKMPLTIFIALDAMEASTLRADSRIMNNVSVVEIITQPCGPYKLSRCLNQCLRRSELHANESASSNEDECRSPNPLPQSRALSPPCPEVAVGHVRQMLSVTSIDPSEAGEPDALELTQEPSVLPDGVLWILAVDDNKINLRLLSAFMDKQCYLHKEAMNGAQALEAYKGASGRFQYVLMDLSMPVMDGMTATRKIREYEQEAGIKPATIIALTGLASANARVEALASGVDHFMTKPVKFQLLNNVLTSKRRRSKSANAV